MRQTLSENTIVVIAVCSSLILLLVCFITWIIYRYQQKQNAYFKDMEEIRAAHENILLQSQVEMQEKTFQNIAIEIHDNIGQKLSLAKLLLNTLPYHSPAQLADQVRASVDILSRMVVDLSDLGRSMSNEIVVANGIIEAVGAELEKIEKSSLYTVHFEVLGQTDYLEIGRELILFRIIQECLHNIIKHAEADTITVVLEYDSNYLGIKIADNGKGFDSQKESSMGTGIKNITKRINLLAGIFRIESDKMTGTQINIQIPLK